MNNMLSCRFIRNPPPVTRVPAADPVRNDSKAHPQPPPKRGFRRFFKDSGGKQRAGDLDPRSTWSELLAMKRLLVQEALVSIAGKRSDAEVPDYEQRVERIAIAMHLLRTAGDIVRGSPDMVPAGLWPPLLGLADLLKSQYFTVSCGFPTSQYDPIRTALGAQGFTLMDPEGAAKIYVKHVKTRIAQMRKTREVAPQAVDITA